MSRRPAPTETSARWHVDLRTAQRWHAGRGKHHPPPAALAAGEPGARAMLAWFASLPGAIQSKLSRPFRAEITRLRIAIERGEPIAPSTSPDSNPGATSQPTSPGAPNPQPRASGAASSSTSTPRHAAADYDYATFLRERAARAAGPTPPAQDSTALAELKLQRDYALYQIGLANARRDVALLKDATDTFHRLSSAVYDEEMLAQRLGRELGDTLPRPEAERLARALAYWLARSTDALLAHLTPLLATLTATTTAPLTREELRAHLEPPALATRLLDPFVRAAQINAGHTLPPWLIAAMREALAATLEDGAALFDTLYSSPIPRPLVTSGPSSDPVAAVETPSVSAIPNTPTASAISSDSAIGSGATQTALNKNNQPEQP